MKRREDWFDGQLDLEPERLVFIDETWASTNMARKRGRCPKGERLRMGVPHGHWKTTTFVGALTLRGFIAPFVLDGPIDRNAFETSVEKVLIPELTTGDVVVMDNLSSHKGPRVREMIEAAGARLLYLPPPAFAGAGSTAPTSIRSRWPSPSSRHSCASGRANNPGALGRHRTPHRSRHARRGRKLLRSGRIRSRLIEKRLSYDFCRRLGEDRSAGREKQLPASGEGRIVRMLALAGPS